MICAADRVVGICEQERITRVRAAGFNQTGLPDEAIDYLLSREGARRDDVTRWALAENDERPRGQNMVRLEHHFGHACCAFLTSSFEQAAIVVCDHQKPNVSVWEGKGSAITRVNIDWHGPGFADLYSQCAELLGFPRGQEQRMEALARLNPSSARRRSGPPFTLAVDHIETGKNWQSKLAECAAAERHSGLSGLAADIQACITELLIAFLQDVRRWLPHARNLCVGGSLFYNTYVNSAVRSLNLFDEFFVPINPGNPGLAAGTGLHISDAPRRALTPYLGPSFRAEEIKATLDNCKISYRWASEQGRAEAAVEALRHGRLVAWFEGPMEWGPRALGGRSILANPFAPYVLENLNEFLKQRDAWRGYALSVLPTVVTEHFDGPPTSTFMECDCLPRDPARFRYILPAASAGVRFHTVGADAPAGFRSTLQAFGRAEGLPILVNTSFNGFREPIVCSPRDAIRVFYGTGIDLMVLGDFIVSK